eukprot:scaffold912_cov153-Amphora_coffeaeformis.AAC.3
MALPCSRKRSKRAGRGDHDGGARTIHGRIKLTTKDSVYTDTDCDHQLLGGEIVFLVGNLGLASLVLFHSHGSCYHFRAFVNLRRIHTR